MNDVEKKVEQLFKKRRHSCSLQMPVEIKIKDKRIFMMTQPKKITPLIMRMLHPL